MEASDVCKSMKGHKSTNSIYRALKLGANWSGGCSELKNPEQSK